MGKKLTKEEFSEMRRKVQTKLDNNKYGKQLPKQMVVNKIKKFSKC